MNAGQCIPVEALERWLAIAEPGSSIVYYSGYSLPRGSKAIAYLRALSDAGEINFCQRRRDGGGGSDYVAQRCGEPVPDPAGFGTNAEFFKPRRRERDDDAQFAAQEAILRQLRRAANFGLVCPSNSELARLAGLGTRNQAAYQIRKLQEDAQIIVRHDPDPDRGTVRRVKVCIGDDIWRWTR